MNKMIADRYMIVTSLGVGGMADVYLAMDTILNREVAVKVLRGELSKDPVTLLRFQREANAASKLNHPNVVEVYDVGESDGKYYIVMEYIRGRTLKQLITQRGALHKEEAVNIMIQLVSAVEHAHENNIIHRDIKPQNVLVKDDGTVKITDFGIALAHDSVQLTQSDAVLGSAHYLAPETTRGESATNQIDIYALGIVFYELLRGDVPFHGDNPVQIAMKHLREEIPSIREFNPTLPQSIENIITKATVKNRVYRYQSASEMLNDLKACLSEERANDSKFTVNIEDVKEDKTVVLNTISHMDEKSLNEESNDIRKDTSKRKTGTVIGIILSVIALSALIGGLILAGTFSKKEIQVPDVVGLNKEDAITLIENAGLTVSTNIREDLSDKYGEGIVIQTTPDAKSSVKKGDKVTLVVSRGKWVVLDDYVGENVNTVRTEFKNLGVRIKINVTEKPDKDHKAGTILLQNGLKKGTKIDPDNNYVIDFVVAVEPSFVIDGNLIGMKVEEAKKALEEKGAVVELKQLSTENMSEDEIAALTKDVVVEITPRINSYYTQTKDSKIVLGYY